MTNEQKALEIAAQLWCLPQHGHKEMDVEFAKSISQALLPLIERIDNCEKSHHKVYIYNDADWQKRASELQSTIVKKDEEIERMNTIIYSTDTPEWKSATFQKIKGLESELTKYQTMLGRCEDEKEELEKDNQRFKHELDLHLKTYYQHLDEKIKSLESKLAIAKEAFENIMQHQELATGGKEVKLSATWNIAKSTLKKLE